MCLTLEKKYQQKIAEKDITCYKCVCDDLTSPCMGFQYKVGKEYSLLLKIHIKENAYTNPKINVAFHTFAYKTDAKKRTNTNWARHFGSTDFLWNTVAHVKAPVILKCVIPKGSVYYVGTFDNWDHNDRCYASEKLRVIEIVK